MLYPLVLLNTFMLAQNPLMQQVLPWPTAVTTIITGWVLDDENMDEILVSLLPFCKHRRNEKAMTCSFR